MKGSLTGGIFTQTAKEKTDAALLAENYAFVDNNDDTYSVSGIVE